MKKILAYSLFTAACVLLSGCKAVYASDNRPTSGYINENITVRSGYYTCEEDDSYIHVDGNMIERCNFDYAEDAEKVWNELMEECDEQERERQAPNHDIFIENSVQWAKEFDALQEFVVHTYPLSTYQPEESDITKLVLNYELAKTTGTYSGYDYNAEDGSIQISGYIYCYAGEELPKKAD